jgi:hypothetical protein
MRVRTPVAGYMLLRWGVDASPDQSLQNHAYRLWLKDHLALYGVKSAVLAMFPKGRTKSMNNIFGFRDQLIDEYSSFSRSFSRIAAADIRDEVERQYADGRYWPEPRVLQRVGQNKFREAMLDYWGGACAVTGVAIPQVLRASHAKPWSECASDAGRLDVFNGFLLSANLDALFDRYLISFDEQGELIIAPDTAII